MMTSRQVALEAIRRKLVGKKLSYREYYAIINEMVHGGLDDVAMAHFAAVGFNQRFNNKELYYLTKAMIETGDKLKFSGIVADKHSVGGIPGYRTTLVIVPIVAAAGLKIPKTSTRAITSPAGTADVMEVLAKVDFSPEAIKKMVEKVGGCIVWGGAMYLAPADSKIIKMGRSLAFESYDKIVASVMAKKIAAGVTHLVVDVPYGRKAKIKSLKYALLIEKKIKFLAKKFGLKVVVEKAALDWPIGHGVGSVLEARDCLRVLQQKENRSMDLETRALELAGSLLQLCGKKRELAKELLVSGKAFEKMREIIFAQKGRFVDSEELRPGEMAVAIKSGKIGLIKEIVNRNIVQLCRVLGAPKDKKAGMYLRKRIGEEVKKGEALFSFYSSDKIKLGKAKRELKKGLEIYKID